MFAALDIHKNFSHAIICGEDGRIIKEGRIKTTEEDIRKFFANYKPTKVALEATTLSTWIVDVLDAMGIEPKVAHPYKTRLIAESQIKTDKIDAEILVHLLRTNLLPTSYIPPRFIRELRALITQRVFYGRLSGKLKNRIYSELNRRGIKYETKRIFGNKGKEWLRSLNIRNITSNLSLLEHVEKEIKALDIEIIRIGKEIKEVRLLTTIPGVGWYSALLIYAYIGDIERFPSEEKFFSYAGLVPGVKQSGDKRYYGRIINQSCKLLRWILIQDTWAHICAAPDSKISRHYEKLRKKKCKQVAIVGAARKLAQVIYWMLKKGKEYEG